MNAATAGERTRISVNRYQKMLAAGILRDSDRIELLNGDMVNRAPIGPKHASITARLTKQFVLQVGDAAIVSPGRPVNLGNYSEPQPDVTLLRSQDGDYSDKIPEAADVLLISLRTVGGYALTLQFSPTDSVTPLLLPMVQLRVQTLFA